MTIIKNVEDCSTFAVRGLDNQIIATLNTLTPDPNLLVRINDIKGLVLGESVHPYMQKAARVAMVSAIAQGRKQGLGDLKLNSAYRTLAGQALLYKHYQAGTCGISIAAPPGKSNHNNASAIDVEDWQKWKPTLIANGWHWLGGNDPMHFDCTSSEIKDIRSLSVLAFQKLWNLGLYHSPNNLNEVMSLDKIRALSLAQDSVFGAVTEERLMRSPAEGFADLAVPRRLCLTNPIQVGNDVGKVQQALIKCKIPIGIDRVFGKETFIAVKKFQQQNNLVADGVVGETTYAILVKN